MHKRSWNARRIQFRIRSSRLYIVRLIRRIYVMSGYMSLSRVTFFVPLEEINGYVAS